MGTCGSTHLSLVQPGCQDTMMVAGLSLIRFLVFVVMLISCSPADYQSEIIKIQSFAKGQTQNGKSFVFPKFTHLKRAIATIENNKKMRLLIEVEDLIPSNLKDPLIIECYLQRPKKAGLWELVIVAPFGGYRFATSPSIQSEKAGLLERSVSGWKFIKNLGVKRTGNKIEFEFPYIDNAMFYLILIRYQPKQNGDANELWGRTISSIGRFERRPVSFGIPRHPEGSG